MSREVDDQCRQEFAGEMDATMALHPALGSIASVSKAQREDINKKMAVIFQNLLTVSCRTEARQAVKYEGPMSLRVSFQILGQIAARELFSNPKVASGIKDIEKYIDKKRLHAALGLKK